MIIQFSHPGKELEIKRNRKYNQKKYVFNSQNLESGSRLWNNDQQHYRKFMKHPGWYLDNIGNTFNPKPKKGELCFWGEWEPQSKFELTGNPYSTQPSLPHAIHKPYYTNERRGKHNTDPFVFGKNFYYTNCKQKQTGRGKKMLKLQPNSIILFGSERNRTDFVIDTLFVVESNETVKEFRNNPENYPDILREATIDNLAEWHQLYKGKMYDIQNFPSINKQNMFCLFPCKVDCESTGFERPRIKWEKYGLQKPGAYSVLKELTMHSEFDFWDKIVEDIIQQGFSLGVKLEMPLKNQNSYKKDK